MKYDVIVVGAGHAGNEAAAAAAKLGCSTLLITMDMAKIGSMSCNPAMGGIAKGQIVREIDALGGLAARVADASAIQFRMLNRSKGAAMWSPRTQNDRTVFSNEYRKQLEAIPTLNFWQEMVTELIVENNKIAGVRTQLGVEFYAKAVVLTNGTFLNGLIHIGEKNFGGGRAGERAATGLTGQLRQLGFSSGRMKTGTPPRIDGRTIDYSQLGEQPGDEQPSTFSFLPEAHLVQNQLSCHIAYTNDRVHELLRIGFDRSPMFNGAIQSTGPRYCPSIEDKINRFADRDRHQLFVEPEGRNTVEVYLNGFSTSLPFEVQLHALRAVPGFQEAEIFRPGYAIEYDYFPPTQLRPTLETQLIHNLFFAGQINGTTGYEEAGAQGLMAGINAAAAAGATTPLVLNRSQAYIGVLIDDLVTKGTDEPYRMFTSRAEYRILLRQDNADERLVPIAHEIGLADDERLLHVQDKYRAVQAVSKLLHKLSLDPEEANPVLDALGSAVLRQKVKAASVLTRPEVTLATLEQMDHHLSDSLLAYPTVVKEQAEIRHKYNSYIEREQEQANKVNRLEYVKLNDELDYFAITSLSAEAKNKLSKHKPATVGQASRISGISPADVSLLLVHLGR